MQPIELVALLFIVFVVFVIGLLVWLNISIDRDTQAGTGTAGAPSQQGKP